MARRPLALSVLLALGCGGTVTPSAEDAAAGGDTLAGIDGASTPSDTGIPAPFEVGPGPFDFCKELGSRASTCGSGFDPTKCAHQLACYQTIVRPVDRDGLLRCLVTRDCVVTDDRCVAVVASKYTTDPAVSEYVKTCTEKRAACSASFADDYCGFDHGILTDEWRTKMRACLDQPCAAVAECFRTVVGSAGCG